MTTSRRVLQTACTAVVIASFAAVCAASSAGPIRRLAGLTLLCAFAGGLWLMRRRRFDAIVPAIGLALAFLILAGLALASVHALTTVPAALAVAVAALAAVWAGAPKPRPSSVLAVRRAWLKPPYPLAIAGVLIFAAATVLAVHYSADGATADADGASSVALWAYPSSGRLHVGAEQPAGHGVTSVRIVVTQAGVTVATWNDIRLAPGQSWDAPTIAVASGKGPVQVVALDGGTVVARLSSQ